MNIALLCKPIVVPPQNTISANVCRVVAIPPRVTSSKVEIEILDAPPIEISLGELNEGEVTATHGTSGPRVAE